MNARIRDCTGALLLALAGCSGGGAGPGGAQDLAGTGAAPDLAMATVEACQADGQPVALAGRYGIKGSLNVNVKVPSDCSGDSCILDQDAVASLLLLADVTQQGATVMVTARPCRIEIPPVALKGQPMPTRLAVPDALVQSVKPKTATGTLSGASTCAQMKSDALAIVLGARLSLPASDPLPTFSLAATPPVALCGHAAATLCDANVENGCICDQEGDGKAGATVGASGVPVLDDVDRVYLALRTVIALTGQVFPASATQSTPGQRLKGTVDGLTLEQSPVGCHHMTGIDCNDQETNSVAQLNPKVTQSKTNPSTFVAMPVPADETCAQLAIQAASLFRDQ